MFRFLERLFKCLNPLFIDDLQPFAYLLLQLFLICPIFQLLNFFYNCPIDLYLFLIVAFILFYPHLRIFVVVHCFFRDRGRAREERNMVVERNINWLPHVHAPTGCGTCNPGMCLDWESNPQHWCRDNTPTN